MGLQTTPEELQDTDHDTQHRDSRDEGSYCSSPGSELSPRPDRASALRRQLLRSELAPPSTRTGSRDVIRSTMLSHRRTTQWPHVQEDSLLARITVNPEIFRGKPIVRGRRLAVEHVLGMLAAGDSIDDLLREYPWLERDDISGLPRVREAPRGSRAGRARC